MKKNISRMRIAFFIASVVSCIFALVFIFGEKQTDVFDVVIGVSSVLVTVVLGIATYYQAQEQNQIDMLDKVPYLKIVFLDNDEIHLCDMKKNEFPMLTNNVRYIKLRSVRKSENESLYSLDLKFRNVSDCNIKRVTNYFFDGCYKEKKNCFELTTNSPRLKFAYMGEAENATDHQKIMRKAHLNSTNYEWDLLKNEEFECEYIVESPINNEGDGLGRCSLAFEMESIYGYTYTQYLYIVFTLAGLSKDGCLMAIIDYDVEIKPKKINSKFLKK